MTAIPAWNEQDSITTVIHKEQEQRPDSDILVINDGVGRAMGHPRALLGARFSPAARNVDSGLGLGSGRWARR